MIGETKEERAKRKAIWMAKATAHIDNPKIRQEASAMFEENNPLGTYCKVCGRETANNRGYFCSALHGDYWRYSYVGETLEEFMKRKNVQTEK